MAPQAAESILQQSAAGQREPSMEEILASIRRIIEDSDAVRTVEETVIPQAANASSSTARSHTSDIDAFREELRKESPDVAPAVEATTPEPVDFVAPPVSVLHREPEAAEDLRLAPEPAPVVSAWAPASSAPAVELDTPKQSIISEVAGRQVAAAFGNCPTSLPRPGAARSTKWPRK